MNLELLMQILWTIPNAWVSRNYVTSNIPGENKKLNKNLQR